jgi:hypothetical protein
VTPAPSLAIAAASNSAPEHAAATAINDITAAPGTANMLADIPADFRQVMGYQPTLGTLANGEVVAIDPDGGCSVLGGGEPFDLSTACKAHDLGYDLLRYAHRQGDQLGSQARMQIDNKFGHDLNAQCTGRYSGAEVSACKAMAVTFDAGVGFNSWRQQYQAPSSKAGMARTIGVIAFAALLVYFVLHAIVVVFVRRIRRSLGHTLVSASQD